MTQDKLTGADYFKQAKRIVIKLGSGLVSQEGDVDVAFFKKLAKEIRKLKDQGKEIVLVSSGAIACGMDVAGLKRRPSKVSQKQAIAAIGQPILMHTYNKYFSKEKLNVAQILLTRDGLQNRKQFLNAKHALKALFDYGVVPIVNENDTVAIDEIQVGDNDQLSALVAHLVDAHLLLILTDIDGLYDKDPKKYNSAQKISFIEKITPEVMALAGSTQEEKSTGGMRTKLIAAKQAASYGIPTWLLSGKKPQILGQLSIQKDCGTFIFCGRDKLSSRKYWIAYALKAKGQIVVDQGAQKALVEGNKSLLPSGIKEVRGTFQIGDPVQILSMNNSPIAQGLIAYHSFEIEKIKGTKSSEIQKILGYKNADEVIHRDDLVLL